MKLATNRKAYYEFNILQEYTAGIVLLGSEVKSIRNSDVTISDCFAYIKSGEIWVKNMRISQYKQSHLVERHDDCRDKKLLLKRREIDKIEKLLQDKGTTMVPLEIFTLRNRIKVKLGVVKGKKLWNKKEAIKERDIKRETKLYI